MRFDAPAVPDFDGKARVVTGGIGLAAAGVPRARRAPVIAYTYEHLARRAA